jgi:hypothetical protein
MTTRGTIELKKIMTEKLSAALIEENLARSAAPTTPPPWRVVGMPHRRASDASPGHRSNYLPRHKARLHQKRETRGRRSKESRGFSLPWIRPGEVSIGAKLHLTPTKNGKRRKKNASKFDLRFIRRGEN